MKCKLLLAVASFTMVGSALGNTAVVVIKPETYQTLRNGISDIFSEEANRALSLNDMVKSVRNLMTELQNDSDFKKIKSAGAVLNHVLAINNNIGDMVRKSQSLVDKTVGPLQTLITNTNKDFKGWSSTKDWSKFEPVNASGQILK